MVRETRLLLLLGALLPCSSYANSAFPPVVTRATCIFQSDTVSGHVSFSRPVGAAAMTLQYDVEGLTPGEHKWHVHSYGDVSQDTSLQSTGGHFIGSPTGARTEIGMITPNAPTATTLVTSKIVADAAGRAVDGFGDVELTDPQLTFGGVNSILGRSLVIHGDSSGPGVRVAMCVIGVAQESTSTLESGDDASLTRTTRSVGAVAMTARVSGVRATATSGSWVFGQGFTGDEEDDKYWGFVRASSKPAGIVTGLQLLENTPAAAMLPAGGTVTVYEEVDATGKPSLRLRYTIHWATGATPVKSGIHIHEGTSCADPGAHFWNTEAVGNDDPWDPIQWNEAVAKGALILSIGTTDAVYAGYTLDDVIGRTVVIHENTENNAKVACGVIERAPGGALALSWEIGGTRSDSNFDFHVHSGATCGDVGGHHYDSDLIDASKTISTTTPNGADPWWSVNGGFWGPLVENEMSKGSDVVATGYNLHEGAGYSSDVSKFRTVVIHDKLGQKIACSVLSPDTSDYGGSKIDGRVTFTNTKPTAKVVTTGQYNTQALNDVPDQTNPIRIDYFFSGLVPGPHKLHVHTLGNVLSNDAASVGGHYIGSTPAFIDAPGITGEAGSEKKVAYLQDGVPIVADANGVAQGSFTDRTKFLLGGGNNVLGRAIVLHSPVAGAKVAQGVIGLANPDASGSLSMLEYSDEVVSNDAGEAAMAQKINFASTMDIDKAGEPMVKGATCTFVRGGGVQGVYPDGFDSATSSTGAPKDSTARDTSEVGNLQGTVRFQERHSNGSPSGMTMGITWELSGMSHGKDYSWHVHTLGDTARTDALGVSGHYVGAGVNRAAVLAKLKGFKAGDTDNEYGAVSVSRPLSAVFEGVQSKYPGYSRTLYAPVGAVAVTQVADPVAAGAQTSVSPTLRVDYDLTGLEPSDRSMTTNFAIVGGIHIHTGTDCASAGGHLYDTDLVSFDPWTTMYGPTDRFGGARGSFLIRSGHSAKQVAGRVIVLHDSTGARMACAVLSLSGTKRAPLQLDFAVTNLGANTAAGGLHIHSGTSCASEQTQGGHDYDTSVTVVDPWGANTVYTTDSTNRGRGSFIVFNTGRTLQQVLGKVIVLHDAGGARKACGVITAAEDLSSGMLATSADYDPRTVSADGRMDNSCLTTGDRDDPESALSGTPGTCLEAAMIGNSARLPGPSNHTHGEGVDYGGKGYTSGAIEDSFLTLNGPNSILGRSIVVHENGRRVGACVIGRAFDFDAHDSVKTPKVVPSERSEGAKCILQSTGSLSPPPTVARLQTWPDVTTSTTKLATSTGTGSRALPRGEAVLSETEVLQAGDFTNMGAGSIVLNTKSKVWLGQTGDDVTMYYALKYDSGTAVNGKNYGIHVHTGTDCATAQTQGGHMWLPRSEKDPWAGAASPYTYVLSAETHNNVAEDVAYGSFVIKGGAGYTMADMVGRVIVVHVDAQRVACAKLAFAPGIALTYDITGGVMPGVKGSMHVSKIAAKKCTAPASAQVANFFTSEDSVKGLWNDYWHSISYTADAAGRARGAAVVPSTFSAYDAQGATVVFYGGLFHSDTTPREEEGPIACGDLAWEYGAGPGPASFRGGAQASVGRSSGQGAGEIGGYVNLENSRATGGKTRISWHVTGLEAKSKHKWHVHNFGDVTPNTGGMRTGGHFVGVDPSIGSSDAAAAAKWLAEGGEVGYIGNGAPYPAGLASVLSADATGVSEGEIMDDYIALSGPNSVIGRSIIIHGFRRNAAGNWISGRAAMCTIGRADPESDSVGGKHYPASTSSTGGVYFTSISAYPGYEGPLKESITGIVTIGQLDRETVVLGYELGGLGTGPGDIGVVDGIHIHAGTSCDTSTEVGGHYWDASLSKSDPWTVVEYNPVDTSMNTRGSLNIISGYSLAQNKGRTIVVHHNGTKVGCGVLGNSLTAGGGAEVAAAASGGGNCPGGFSALIEPYPGYVPADGSISLASGIVTVGQIDRHTVSISYQLSGLTIGESGGLHIHTGLTCDSDSEVGGHYWNEAVEAEDPWTAANGAVFSSAVEGIVSGLASGTSAGTFELKSGFSLVNNAGHAVVVHNAAGDRIGCGILASRADDPGFASIAEAALAFASQKTNTAALIDSPQEVLTFALSLAGVFILALLIGVCLGRRCERNANDGGGRSNDMTRRKSSKRLDDSAVAIEMSYAPDPGPKPKRVSLRAGIANPLETGAAPLPAGPPTPRTQNTLPSGWIEQVSGTHGKVYYYNTQTGESLWERPTKAV